MANKIKIILWNIAHEILYFFKGRDKSIVVMGAWSGNRFSDNTRFLYQYLSKNKERLHLSHVVWVTRNEKIQKELTSLGYEAYMMESEESIYFQKKAAYHFVCNLCEAKDAEVKGDILAEYSNGAKKVNFWHGLGGIKGVEFASGQYMKQKQLSPKACAIKEFLQTQKWYRVLGIRYGGWGDCKYLSTTSFETDIFRKYFLRPQKYFIECGYPRNEKCLEYLKDEKEILDFISTKKNRILYLPTFRDNTEQYVEPLKSKEFCEMLKSNDVLWIQKPHGIHTAGDLSAGDADMPVLNLDSSFDVNILVPYVDVIVTDYSSVAWDALYHKKPVIFYVPDLEYYKNDDRGFILPPEEFLIGQASYSMNELQKAVVENLNHYDSLLPSDVEEIWKKIWGKKANYQEIWDALK